MRLSWNEIRFRAHKFAEDHKNSHYEKGETQTFYNEFFQVFGIERRRVARYEELIKRLDNKYGYIDLYWPKVLLVEHKSFGRDLKKAEAQAGEYFDAIEDINKPRWQLLCDFQTFELLDRDTRESWSFQLSDLPNYVELFSFILGIEKRVFRDQDPVNIAASELMGEIHDALASSGYEGDALELYLVRLLFMLFADDTGIFEPRDILLDFIETRTREDGSDVGPWLNRLFEVLNTPEDRRQKNLDDDLKKFPYINGDLFSAHLETADFNSGMRETLIEACRFNWSAVSPAIFGSLFQSVMNGEERRKKGAHYTTEMNIMKVIGPLFLDDLNAEFARIDARKDARRKGELEAFRQRLGKLTFFDPACGCGNFLIIAYRELRLLEIRVLEALLRGEVKYTGESRIAQLLKSGASGVSVLDVDQFYGIELEEFPARIAEVAMWMTDHIMNNQFSLAFNAQFARIPLKKSPHIRHGNALELDWHLLLPPENCTFILGNPPFIGKHLRSDEQQADMDRMFGVKGGSGTLDYVAAWFLKAAQYIQQTKIKCAFVSTNSITQGEQVSILWRRLLDQYKVKIHFAHRTFAWGSDARGKAHVHCVIVGFGLEAPNRLRLFDYSDVNGAPTEVAASHISPYLVDYRPILIEARRTPLKSVPPIIYGSKPVDGGNLILSATEKDELSNSDPVASRYVRPLLSADEYLNGETRWCLWLVDATPAEIKSSPELLARVKAVREFRRASPKAATRTAADRANEFAEIRQPKHQLVVVPMHTSQRREYVPFGYEDATYVVHNSCTAVADATISHFGIMLSAMHMTWLRYTAGRIKSDYRYANTLVYNTFPWPDMSSPQEERIGQLAQNVLDERSAFPESTLADLYDPDLMPSRLRKAHRDLDHAVDRLYRRAAFASDRDRVEHLFGLYEKLTSPIEAAAQKKGLRARRSSSSYP